MTHKYSAGFHVKSQTLVILNDNGYPVDNKAK